MTLENAPSFADVPTIAFFDTDDVPVTDVRADADPGLVILTCANCGAAMDERKCKLICRCGYFLSCSDYY
jgi:hypothetical protein